MEKVGKIILVTGATGLQGGAVVRHLLMDGWTLRALTRNPDSDRAKALAAQGVEVVKGDFEDTPSLRAAFSGVYGAFIVATPYEKGVDAETRQGIAAVNAAKAGNVSRLVYSSVGSAHLNTGIPHFESKWEVEKHIASLDMAATIVRPVFFMENLAWGDLKEGIDKGVLSMALPAERRLQFVAVDDIGYFVARAFGRPDEYMGQAFDLAGDELTIPQVAKKYAACVGHEIDYQPFPWQAMMEQNEDWGLMFKWFDEVGYSADIEGLRTIDPDLHDFDHWLAEKGC